MIEVPYDTSCEPPAPVVPVRVSAPGSPDAVLVSAMVDSGADITVIQAGLARQLGLPAVSTVVVEGSGGTARRAPIYAAEILVAGESLMLEVLALGDEALVGRELLSRWVTTLDGPGAKLRIRASAG